MMHVLCYNSLGKGQVILALAEAVSHPTAISEPENKRSYRYGSGQPAGTLHAERSNKAHHPIH